MCIFRDVKLLTKSLSSHRSSPAKQRGRCGQSTARLHFLDVVVGFAMGGDGSKRGADRQTLGQPERQRREYFIRGGWLRRAKQVGARQYILLHRVIVASGCIIRTWPIAVSRTIQFSCDVRRGAIQFAVCVTAIESATGSAYSTSGL